MKTLITAVLISLFSFTPGSEDQNKYENTMKSAIAELYQAGTIDALISSINKFERIAKAEGDKWRPYYYASYGGLMKAIFSMNSDRSKMDPFLDQAQKNLDEAAKLDSHNEITILQGYIDMIRLTVDPQVRGQEYSGKSMASFGKALQVEPNNPRAMMLMGQMRMGTAQFFGQDPAEACKMVADAIPLFDSYEPENELDPVWGKQQAQSVADDCK
jgi:hypothetical protein